eukprot:416986_1
MKHINIQNEYQYQYLQKKISMSTKSLKITPIPTVITPIINIQKTVSITTPITSVKQHKITPVSTPIVSEINNIKSKDKLNRLTPRQSLSDNNTGDTGKLDDYDPD